MKHLTVCAVILSACVHVEATTRTERGPMLRTFHRPQVLEGTIDATLKVDWPALQVSLITHDICRDLEVEEYAEDRITEKNSPTAGPALSTGITTLLASAVLLGVSFIVPAAPDTSVIDRAGNYGPSTQQLVRGWSLGALVVGVPALAVGLIGLAQAGEQTTHLRTEQVINQADTECNPHPANGPASLEGTVGALVTKPVVDGVVTFGVADTRVEPVSLRFGGAMLTLDEAAQKTLRAWAACVALEHDPSPPQTEEALVSRVERLRRCAFVRGEAVRGALETAQAEVQRRQEAEPGAATAYPEVTSFETALAKWSPRLRLTPGSGDLGRLEEPGLEGQAALVQGVVVEGMTSNIGVIQVGERQLYVFLPPNRAWGYDFGNGTRVDAVVVLAGHQTVGQRTLPLARAVWMRPAF